MPEVTLDIETVRDEKVEHLIPEDSDPEKITFDSNFNKIACIAVYNGSKGKALGLQDFDNDESALLETFWNGALKFQKIITFNGLGFDIPFIYKRSLLNRVKPTIWISQVRYYVKNHLDIYAVMNNWNTWGARGGLDLYSNLLLNKPGKDGICGADVQKYWDEGKYEEVCDYCIRDCRILWEIYEQMRGYYECISY